MPTTILIIALVLLLFIAAIVLFRTLRMLKPQPMVEEQPGLEVDTASAAERLGHVIRCETVSMSEESASNAGEFRRLHRLIEEMFPGVHSHLTREPVNEYSLLYTWQGIDPDLPALVFMAHLDVVPADPSTLEQWEHKPFSGEIADGFVWGRGTLDIKSQAMAILEAVEMQVQQGYQPKRTIYLAFGHDEEIGGTGQAEIVRRLNERGVRIEAVLDEGGSVIQGSVPGVKSPVALIGVAEKGYLTAELNVSATPGHSSMPPRQTAIGILAAALTRIESAPQPTRLDFIQQMFQTIGDEAPFKMQMVFANLWLFRPLAVRTLQKSPATNAVICTTRALTIVQGGVKDNVLPANAMAKVNFRLLPGDTVESMLKWIKDLVNDERVTVKPSFGAAWNPSPVSPLNTPTGEMLVNIVRRRFGPVPVSPLLVAGATDARQYAPYCPQTYRFTPLQLHADDLKRVHGINERIGVENYGRMIQFFGDLIPAWGE
jgi:carboxypeptidase PM20D1